MKSAILVGVFVFAAALSGCSSSEASKPAANNGQGTQPENSGGNPKIGGGVGRLPKK